MTVSDFSGRAIIQIGGCWIATPVAREAFSAVAFAIESDYLQIGIALDALAILLHSLLPA